MVFLPNPHCCPAAAFLLVWALAQQVVSKADSNWGAV